MEQVNKLWSILNGKYTLPESLRILGSKECEINIVMRYIELNGQHDASMFFSFLNKTYITAYKKLVVLKEIDDTRIFNLASKKFDNGDAMEYNSGIMGNETFVFINKKWRPVSNQTNVAP